MYKMLVTCLSTTLQSSNVDTPLSVHKQGCDKYVNKHNILVTMLLIKWIEIVILFYSSHFKLLLSSTSIYMIIHWWERCIIQVLAIEFILLAIEFFALAQKFVMTEWVSRNQPPIPAWRVTHEIQDGYWSW